MNKKSLPEFFILVFLSFHSWISANPVAEKELASRDPYAYMRNLSDPRVLKYINEENEFAELQLNPLKTLRTELYEELIADVTTPSVEAIPYIRNGFTYYTKQKDESELICRKKNASEFEEVVLDEGFFSEYGISLVSYAPSPDGRFVAFLYDRDPSAQHYLGIRDLCTGEFDLNIAENIDDTLVWTCDNKYILVLQKDSTDRAYQVCRYSVEDSAHSTQVLYQEDDLRFHLYMFQSHDESLIFFYSITPTTTEIHFMPADSGEATIQLYLPRKEGMRYKIENYDRDHFFVLANIDTLDSRLFVAPKNISSLTPWEEIPFDPQCILCDVLPFENHLVVVERLEGLPALEIIDLQDGSRNQLHFDEPVFAFELQDNYEYSTDILRFLFWSPKTPHTLIDYDMRHKEMHSLHQELPYQSYDPSLYVTDRIFAIARDGTRVPMTILRKRSLDISKPVPLVLWGYGGYGDPEEPEFSKEILCLVNRDVIFAWAHVRGGGEFGRIWYEQGRMMQKKRTFTDFIDCAQYLFEKGYTNPEQLAIWGRSAGGMLIGAVINMQPDLFKAAIADVPFVDVLNTMLDPSKPWTTQEYGEWGNPQEQECYQYMSSYCPYENVQSQKYPALFFTGGVFDRLVSFSEPLKLTAKLRDKKTDQNQLILNIDFEGGHFRGKSPNYPWITSGKLAFLLDQIAPKFSK